MSDEGNKRAKRIFSRAAELSGADREDFLFEACDGDEGLLGQVRELLRLHGEGLLPAGEGTVLGALHEGPGTRIGPYKILQLIGEGGFGSVFMAEQERPVQRRVALKIIKLGMDTKQVIARFEAERQALAIMDHPNIAKVFDAGATEAGRPYFVMELVRGDPITEYCDKHNLGPRERVELAVHVCNAVQHAHQKGVIHRDLKPSNILVTVADERAIPKVIDFGIAKATAGRLTEKTVFTEHRQFIGTPEYMSPEQAEMTGVDIDTRSDIYSLGVLLYELLTATTPFDGRRLRSAAFDEVRRIIREEDPPRPSTRLSTLGGALPAVAAHRGSEPGRLGRLLRHELDWVVMKCLEKDRTRRYETASALAADLQCYLDDRPVMAARPGAVHRLSRFLKRNRRRVSFAATVVGLIFAVLFVAARGIDLHRGELARQERDALAMLAEFPFLDASKAGAIQPVVDRILDRIMSGKATAQETQRFLEVIEPVSIEGRPIQELGNAQVVIRFQRRMDIDTSRLFIIPGANLKCSDLQATRQAHNIPDPYEGAEVWDGVGNSRWLGQGAFTRRGAQAISGSAQIKIARLPKEFEQKTRDVHDPSIQAEVIGPPIRIEIHAREFMVVDEFPAEYPFAIESRATRDELRKTVTLQDCTLEQYQGELRSDGVVLSLGVRLGAAAFEFPVVAKAKVRLTLAGAEREATFLLRFSSGWFANPLGASANGFALGGGMAGWTVDTRLRWYLDPAFAQVLATGAPSTVHITIETSRAEALADPLCEAYATFEPLRIDLPVNVIAPKP